MRKLIAATIILGTGLFFQQPDIARAEYLNTMTIPAAKQSFFSAPLLMNFEIANDETLYVFYHDKIQRFSPSGPEDRFVQQWISPVATLDAAQTTGIDSLGNLYLLYTKNRNITRMASSGDWLPTWYGGPGPGPVPCTDLQKNFSSTNRSRITISNSDKLYIVNDDPGSPSISVLNTNGDCLARWYPPQGLATSWDIAVNSQEEIYILSSYNTASKIINKFSKDGEYLGINWLTPSPLIIRQLEIDSNDNVYTISTDCIVDQYSPNGELIKSLHLNTPFPGCENLKISKLDDFYISSSIFTTFPFIQKYDSNLGLLEEWSSGGSRDGKFNMANDVFVNNQGTIFVADKYNNRIQIFGPDGALLSKFGSNDTGDSYPAPPGYLYYPTKVVGDQIGNIFVIDSYGSTPTRVQKFAANGSFIAAITPKHADGSAFNPQDIDVDSEGNILIVSQYKGIIRQLSSDLQTTIANMQSHVNGTSKGIAIDSLGNIRAFWSTSISGVTQDVVESFSPTGEYLSAVPINFADANSKTLINFAVDSQGGIHAIASAKVADPITKMKMPYLVHIDSDRAPVELWKDGNPRGTMFRSPQIYIDSSDNIYVADNTRILKYSYQEENSPPVARPDNYTLLEDSSLSVAGPGVLSNDTDPDADQLSARLVIGPLHGQLALNADGSFTYSPLANFNGTDSFTYEISDVKGELSSAVVTLNVLPVNDVPVVTINQAAPINEGVNLFLSGLFTDPDPDTWTVTVNYGDGSPEQQLIPDPSHAFSMNHVYKDDGMYQVAITVLDSQGGIGSATTAVSVQNVAPVPSIDMIADGANVILADISINLLGSFIDPGVLDTHSVTINWGDGTNQTINPAVSPLNATHIYASPQTNSVDYTLTLTVQDNGGAVGVQSRTVTVVKPAGAVQDINNGLTDLLQSGTVTPAAAVDIADALTLLNGQTNANGTTSQSGAIAKFDTGQINAAMVKLIDAIQKLLDSQTADPSLNLESQLVMLTLTAKAAAVDAVNAAASNGTPINKIDEANFLIAVGNTKLELDDYIGAALSYKAAVQKVQ